MRINNQNNNQNFKALSSLSAPLGQFYNANATIPTLLIETGVTLGRAYEANKRGGMPEAVDRLVEQGIGAVVWIYGVKILKNIGEFIGKKVFNIKNFDFDIGFDELRNPTKYINKKALGFKAGNILISTALATYFMGTILPKINNAILKKTLKKQQKEKSKKETALKTPSFKDFQKTTGKNIAFTSLYDIAVNSAHILENNSTARLFITDTGVITGRFKNAPNKYRKIEGLFRDIASIYFYLASTSHIVKGLNKLTKNIDIDPKTLEKTIQLLQENPDFDISKPKESDLEKLKNLFGKEKTISLEKMCEAFPARAQKASQMASMQFSEKGKEVLSYRQAYDTLSDSITSDPKFLKETYEYVTGKKDISNPTTYISSKSLDKIRISIDKFVEQVENLKDKKTIEQIANSTIRKNFAFNCIGTAISIYALGFLIPKIQYAITKKMTNENKFHIEED